VGAVGQPPRIDAPLPVRTAYATLASAFSLLARGVLRRHRARVVAITGSVGKTTTKELLVAMLAGRYDVAATPGNANSELAVTSVVASGFRPRTPGEWARAFARAIGRLSARAPFPEILVLETAAGRAGELERTTRAVRPDIAVVLAVGSSHLEYFGSPDAIAEEKSWPVRRLRPGGVAVLNFGDERVRAQAALAPGRVISYSTVSKADVWAEDVRVDADGTTALVHASGEPEPLRVTTKLLGRHQLACALAALAAAIVLDVAPGRALQAVADFRPVPGRLRALAAGPMTVLDDAYNASPEAVLAALEVLAGFPAPRVAVLGELRELGPYTEPAYRAVAAGLGPWLDELIVVGRLAAPLATAAREHGLDASRVQLVETVAAAERLLVQRRAGGTVLVKGTSKLRLDRLVDALVRDERAVAELETRGY
jgi:UDP-N-acetylmuramoyl-tripeptide--D-alanyl-D-alanine ligase